MTEGVIEALVRRYRSRPALAGWNFGVGATGEDNYGPNYITLMGFGNSDLFRRADPDHLLILSAASDDAMPDGSLSDGISFSLGGTVDKGAERMFYYLAMDIIKRAAARWKLAIVTSEHVCDGMLRSKTGECETREQLDFLAYLGTSVKCAGGIFAYAAAPYDQAPYYNGSWLPPVWFTGKTMAVARKINEFTPVQGCACGLAGKVRKESGCDRPAPRPNATCSTSFRILTAAERPEGPEQKPNPA